MLVNEREGRLLAHIVRRKTSSTTSQITCEFNSGALQIISGFIIRRNLQRMGVHSRRPSKVPLLSRINIKHSCCGPESKKVLTWGLIKCNLVAWISFVATSSRCNVQNSWKLDNTMYTCQITVLQIAAGWITVWLVFSWHTLGPLISVDTIINIIAYLNTLPILWTRLWL